MDPDTDGWGDEGCGGQSTGWIHYFPGAAGAYCCGGGPKTHRVQRIGGQIPDTNFECVQTCPLDTQTRNADGRCKCGLGTPNQDCVAGTTCVNNECVAKDNCNIDMGLAYLGDGVSYTGSNGACTVGYNDGTSWWNANGAGYLAKIRAATLANAQGLAFGQQSNGCWHILKWDPGATGSNKKTKSMYPRYFEVVRQPTEAQCQMGPPDKTGKGSAVGMKCPSQFPYLLPYPAGTTNEYFCYQNPDGNNGKGGLCNCNCANCGYNNSYENCASLGGSCAEACPADHQYYGVNVYGVKYGLCCTKGWSGGKCNGAASLNAGVLSGDILIPPCSSQTITQRQGPDGNGTLVVYTDMNPEGIAIYNTDVAILGNSPKVYFYPTQPAGMNLYENKIQSKSTDANGTLYLVSPTMQPRGREDGLQSGVRIDVNDASCFANTSSVFIGPGPESPTIRRPLVWPAGVNLDGRYVEGNPARYRDVNIGDDATDTGGGWALKNGLGVAPQCDALCAQQPECHLPGNTCSSQTFTNPARCYCSYQTPPPVANPKKVIHWVGDCTQCSRQWCTGGPKNTGAAISNETANKLYTVGSTLSEWGCNNVYANSEQVSIRAQNNQAAANSPPGSMARGGIFVIESLNPKCSTMTCPEGTSMRNPNTPCAAQSCVADECCMSNPVCSSSICNPITQKLKGSAVSSTIVDVTSCLAAGGSGSYAYCPDNNTHYCAGPCTGTQSCPSNKGLDYNACPPGAQLTTDVPVVISNPNAPKLSQGLFGPYLQMATPSNTLTHSSEKNANFIFRSVNHDQSNPRQPLNYTDKVIIQYAALNNGGRSVDQPDGDTPGCGWYGCRVLQAPNPTNSSLSATFDHGGDDPAVFMLMAPPAYVKDANNFNGPIYNGAPFCLQYAGSLTTGYDVNWGYTPNCGWFGCRILTDYTGQRPDLGEFGWLHGAGKDEAGGGPTGFANGGPTVFTIEAPSEAGLPCKGATCTSAECCNSFETCDTFTCGETYTKKSGSITCAGATCTVNECCNANPTCSAFPCSSGYHLNAKPRWNNLQRVPLRHVRLLHCQPIMLKL